MRHRIFAFAVCSLFLAGISLSAQTFEVGGQSSPSSKRPRGQGPRTDNLSDTIGWGASIEVARQARAAQDANRRGDYAAAADHAERAAKAAPQNTDLWLLLGYSARLAGRYQASLEAYRRALQNKPNSIQGLSGMAQTYAKLGNKDEAKRLVMRVLAANPSSPSDLLMAGELFLDSDAKQAVDLLRRANALRPSAGSELLLAKGYKRLGDSGEAKRHLQRAQQLAPNSPDVLRNMADFYRESHDYDSAIASLQKVPKKTAEVWGEIGYTYTLAGKKKEAAGAYVRAADEAPKQLNLQVSAAQALLNVGDFGKARSYLNRGAALSPNHYRVHAVRADLAEREHRSAEAIREYEAAIRAVPAEGVPEGVLFPIQLRMALAELYQRDDQATAAEQQIQLAAAAIQKLDVSGRERPEFLRLRGSIRAALGDSAAADADLKEALALDPGNTNIMLNYANLLWKIGRKKDSIAMYSRVLNLDSKNRMALTSLGYLSREMENPKDAEKYFTRAAALYPDDYVPFLGLGDLYTSLRAFPKAQAAYEKAHKLAPTHPLIVSGATNAALEAQQLPLAKSWLDRANQDMNEDPNVMRERERYLTFRGEYAESAKLGYKVIEKLPRDRQGAVYLAYDLLYLNRFDEALEIASRYQAILPKDKDLPLILGYVHSHYGLLHEAVQDFTLSLQLAPTATGYVNRGYVLNDLQNPRNAVKDFQAALKLRPDYGEAHLGLAYAYLQLRQAKSAIPEVEKAQKILGPSKAIYLARAEGFRQQQLFARAEQEYRAALKYGADDVTIHLALADVLYRMRRYDDSIAAYSRALALSPEDPFIYARLALNHARLHQEQETMRYVEAAQRVAGDESGVLLAVGESLITLGKPDLAMQLFERALDAPDADRVGARLAIARLFAYQGREADAREQVGLALAEARIGEAAPFTPENHIEAAAILLGMHDFDAAAKFFERAKAAGADEQVIAIGMANLYLAQGQTRNAEATLAALGNPDDYSQNYDYLMARANVYRQRMDNVHALAAFAQASSMSPEDDNAERAQFELAGEQGVQLTDKLSMSGQASVAPILEDINIYTMDARLLHAPDNSLPTPRHSIETMANAFYRVNLNGLPPITGLFQVRNSRGSISFPSQLLIQDRNTYDTSFNGGINPVLNLGANRLLINTGIQFTIRRDSLAPVDMNQNLFRQFFYLSTTPFWNWVAVYGSLIREAGPFTERDLHSRDLSGSLNFVVGRPWGKTALITGYHARDVLFRPLIREYFTTTSYVGLRRRFGNRLTASVRAEYLRSWRVQDLDFALAQAIRPNVSFQYRPNNRWSVQGSFAYSRGAGFHFYDNVQSEFLISYVKPVRRTMSDGLNDVAVSYPFRLTFGLQQQSFYNFPGSKRSTFLPVVRFTFF